MSPDMEPDLEGVVRHLAENRWPWRMHATYDETISRALDVFEAVDKDVPLAGLKWFSTMQKRSRSATSTRRGARRRHRGAARMMYQGEDFVAAMARAQPKHAAYRADALSWRQGWRRHRRDAGRFLQPLGQPLLAGDGAHAGRTRSLSVRQQDGPRDCPAPLDGREHLVSTEEGKKGQIKEGQLADFALLSDDYFTVPPSRSSTSRLNSPCSAAGSSTPPVPSRRSLAAPPSLPDWSPVNHVGGYQSRIRHGRGPCGRTPPIASRRPPAAAPRPAASMGTPTPRLGARQPRRRTRGPSGGRSAAPAGLSEDPMARDRRKPTS